jgi:hypothetical protein
MYAGGSGKSAILDYAKTFKRHGVPCRSIVVMAAELGTAQFFGVTITGLIWAGTIKEARPNALIAPTILNLPVK